MFSPPTDHRPHRSARLSLRERLVRGLDLAVELVTLGEYGVEDVPADGAPCGGGRDCSDGWTWPSREPIARRGDEAACGGDRRASRAAGRSGTATAAADPRACLPGYRRPLEPGQPPRRAA